MSSKNETELDGLTFKDLKKCHKALSLIIGEKPDDDYDEFGLITEDMKKGIIAQRKEISSKVCFELLNDDLVKSLKSIRNVMYLQIRDFDNVTVGATRKINKE